MTMKIKTLALLVPALALAACGGDDPRDLIPTPTPTPTVEPTVAPTLAPTPEPTAAPTSQPTLAPTTTPSVEPTPAPTAEPSPRGRVRQPRLRRCWLCEFRQFCG